MLDGVHVVSMMYVVLAFRNVHSEFLLMAEYCDVSEVPAVGYLMWPVWGLVDEQSTESGGNL